MTLLTLAISVGLKLLTQVAAGYSKRLCAASARRMANVSAGLI